MTLLVALQTYCPLSPLVTFVIVSCLRSDEKLILEPAVKSEPSLVQLNVGAEFPVASQVKVTLSPSILVSFCGCTEN